jgi:hypothetical protein
LQQIKVIPHLQHIIVLYSQVVRCVIEHPELEIEAGFGWTVSSLSHNNRQITFSNDVERRA